MVQQKLYDMILYNRTIKNTAIWLLHSKLLTEDPVYRAVYWKRIRAVIDRYRIAPSCIKLENTNACNSRCVICTHDRMKRKVGFMKRELWEKVLAEGAALGIEHASLHNFGEPLLDKSFPEIARYAKAKGIPRVTTNTNGALLTAEVASEFIDSGLDELFVSFDGATKDTFEKVRFGLNYEKVEGNVQRLIKMKKEKGAKKPLVVVDFVEFDLNRHEKSAFQNKWSGLADHVCISSLHNWGGKSTIDGKGGIHEDYVYARSFPCRLLWTDLVVNWDGRIPLCCQDTENEIILGNANTSKLVDIWQGNAFNQMRQLHLEGRMEEIPVCRECRLHTFWWIF